MDPWKRYRLLACIVVMLGMLGAGVYARLVWGVPERPYGDRTLRYQLAPPRTPNAIEELRWEYERAENWLRVERSIQEHIRWVESQSRTGEPPVLRDLECGALTPL